MRCVLRAFFFAPLLSLICACGRTSGTPPGISPTSYPSLNGNWMVLAGSSVTDTIYGLGGSITSADGSVTATLHVIPPSASSCYQSGQEIPFTGTVTGTGAIALTSGAVGGQTISITGITANGSLLSGTFKIAGGCAGGDSGNVTGLTEPSYSGEYTGALQTGAPNPVGVTATLTQADANADGEFGISGTALFSGSPCFTTGTITSGVAYGNYIQVTMETDKSSTVQLTGLSIAEPQVITISGIYQVTSGPCAGDSGAGTLNSGSSA